MVACFGQGGLVAALPLYHDHTISMPSPAPRLEAAAVLAVCCPVGQFCLARLFLVLVSNLFPSNKLKTSAAIHSEFAINHQIAGYQHLAAAAEVGRVAYTCIASSEKGNSGNTGQGKSGRIRNHMKESTQGETGSTQTKHAGKAKSSVASVSRQCSSSMPVQHAAPPKEGGNCPCCLLPTAGMYTVAGAVQSHGP